MDDLSEECITSDDLEKTFSTSLENKDYETMKTLVEKVNVVAHLSSAVENNDLEAVKIMTKIELDLFQPSEFNNPLIVCMEEDQKEIFLHLLNLLSEEQKNVLLNVVAQLNFPTYLSILLKVADPFYKYQDKDCLEAAIRKGNLTSIEVLLKDNRIQPEFFDLENAVKKDNGQILRILLAYYPENLSEAHRLINIASSKGNFQNLEVLLTDIRINPWNVKADNSAFKQIIEKVKNGYRNQNHYLEKYKDFEKYLCLREEQSQLEASFSELLSKGVSKTNLGSIYLTENLVKTKSELREIKRIIGLLC